MNPVLINFFNRLKKNPIFIVGISYIKEDLSWSRLTKKISSKIYSFKIKRKHCEDINSHIFLRTEYNPYEALLYSMINITFMLTHKKYKDLFSHSCQLVDTLLSSHKLSDEALANLTSFDDIILKGRNYNEFSTHLFNLADKSFSLGYPITSHLLFDLASNLYKRDNHMRMVARCYFNRGIILEALNLFESALLAYKLSLRFYEMDDINTPEVGQCYANIASLHTRMGILTSATEYYKIARRLFREKGLEIDVAKCNAGLSNIYFSLSMFDIALKLLVSTKEVFSRNSLYKYEAICDMNMADIWHRKNNTSKAMLLYERAHEILQTKDDKQEMGFCLIRIADFYLTLGNNRKALGLYNTAQKIFGEESLPEEAVKCSFLIGKLMFESSKYEDALTELEKIIKSPDLKPEILWWSLYYLSKIHQKLGSRQMAIHYLKKSIDTIESSENPIYYTNIEATFFHSIDYIYREMINYYIEENRYDLAVEYMERLRGRKLSDTILVRANLGMFNYGNTIILEKYLENDTSLSLGFSNRFPVEIQTNVIHFSFNEIHRIVEDKNTALLQFHIDHNQTSIFIIKDTGSLEILKEKIDDFGYYQVHDIFVKLLGLYRKISKDDSVQEEVRVSEFCGLLNKICKDLGRIIYLPLKRHLHGIKKLILIPSSMLHLLPLHAMCYDINGSAHYLIDDYESIVYAPSLKMLLMCLSRQNINIKKVLVGLAIPDEFSNLAHFNVEGKFIEQIFGKTTNIESIDKENLMFHAINADILHLIGHGSVKGPFLERRSGKASYEQLTIENILASIHFDSSPLVTLSGCFTGFTDVSTGNDFESVTTGLLYAGAASVVSSLWSVNDCTSSLLVIKMYELIQINKKSISESLLEAQVWLKDPKNRPEIISKLEEMLGFRSCNFDIGDLLPQDLSNPYYWAGFICSGAP